MSAGSGQCQMRSFTLRELLSLGYHMPAERILGEVVEEPTRYDASLLASGTDEDDLLELLPKVLGAAFHISVKRETRPTLAWVLKAPHGRPDLLVKTAGPGGMSQSGNGEIKGIGMPMEEFVKMVQSVLAKPVVDETHLSGAFDVQLKYDAGRPESILDTLRAHGFDAQQKTRPVEFLITTRNNPRD